MPHILCRDIVANPLIRPPAEKEKLGSRVAKKQREAGSQPTGSQLHTPTAMGAGEEIATTVVCPLPCCFY